MKSNLPRVGQSCPRRPFPPQSYESCGNLPDLFRCPATVGHVSLVDFRLTGNLPCGRLADTWSHGVAVLPSGERIPICTSFSRRGSLLLETASGQNLPLGTLADIARAVVAGHVLALARQNSRGAGRS